MIGLRQRNRLREYQSIQTRPLETETPNLISVFNRRQKWTLRLLVAIWFCTLMFFWSWWLRPEHWVTTPLMILSSILLAWTTIMPGWFFCFILRMRRPNPVVPLPMLRVAMIVTKVPSEPWPMVRSTLDGMLQQRFPYAYDVWLADEDPSAETIEWCNLHNVSLSCRKGIADYHRASWPRRTRCKEGNLAYFYDMHGYRKYDAVVQLDADHLPAIDYLSSMIRPFADDTIGYVAAPSMCDKNASDSWAVRARLFTEAPFHGVLQTSYNGGFAPSCIGSHYAVRTKALKQIGGLGPELAEDFTTTLMMSAHGWQGVFAFDAEAHGDGPSSFADYITQEFQWSRSLMNALLDPNINRRYWSRLTPHTKLKLGFGQIWYPVYALQMLLAYLYPIVALSTRTPWANVYLLDFFTHSSMIALASLLIIIWMKAQGWMRPTDSRIWSWEVVLFQFTRWPWVLWGVTQATIGAILGKQFAFRVTPKGVLGSRPLPLITLLPFYVLSLSSGLAALLIAFPGPAVGYYYLCLMNACIYAVVSASVLALHIRENHEGITVSVVREMGPHLVSQLFVWGVVVLSLYQRGQLALFALLPPPVVGNLLYVMEAALSELMPYGSWIVGFLLLLTGVIALRLFVQAWQYRLSGRAVRAVPLFGGIVVVLLITVLTPSPSLHTDVVTTAPAVTTGRAASTPLAAPLQQASLLPVSPTAETTPASTTSTSLPRLTTQHDTVFGVYDPQKGLSNTDLAVEMFYTDLQPASIDALATRLQAIGRDGRVPVVTMEPFPLLPGSLPEQRLLSDLTEGKYDRQLRSIADALHSYHGEILIRFAHEMELENVYPWGAREPQQYIAAYRRVHMLLTKNPGANLFWVWSPAGNADAAQYYPGSDVVDYVGFTALSAQEVDQRNIGQQRRTFADLMNEKYYRAIVFGKPLIVAELGISDTADMQVSWMRDMLRAVDDGQYPALRLIIYFSSGNAYTKNANTPRPNYTLTQQQWRSIRQPSSRR